MMKRSLRSWLWRVPLEQEVDEELAFHVEMRTRELIARGLDPKTARRHRPLTIGDVRQLKRTCVDLGRKRDREMRLTQWLEERGTDVKFALRQLKGSPGFTLVAALTLALGIGANSAIFALADATLDSSASLSEPDRLVMMWERNPKVPRAPASHDQSPRLEGAESAPSRCWRRSRLGVGGGPLLAGPDGSLRSAERQSVTPRFFDVLRSPRWLAEPFRPPTRSTRAPRVVVMTEGLWRTRFGGDPSLIGRQVRLNGQPSTVIGIVADRRAAAAAGADLDAPDRRRICNSRVPGFSR